MVSNSCQQTFASVGDEPREPYDLTGYDWTLKSVETKPGTHGLHSYPARMIPQIPRQLLSHWTKTDILNEGDLIHDPFCGSGTTAVEAVRAGFRTSGTDINPFACLLARTKATPVNPDTIVEAAHEVFSDWHIYRRFIRDGHSVDDPESPTSVALGWFPTPQVYELDSLARRLSEGRGTWDVEIIRFLRICLASIVRDVSFQQSGEFKRQRISESERTTHNPDVWALFCDAVEENVERMRAYVDSVDYRADVTIQQADCRSPDVVESNSVDAVITSPPYGDHGTTVAYGQYCRDPAVASTPLTNARMRDVDPTGLGGTRSGAFSSVGDVTEYSSSLERTVAELRAVDGRSDDALSFFADFFEVINQLARILKPNQPVAMVVGNRTMSRVPIPMHLITHEFLAACGFKHRTTEPRSIPTKRLPWENAPENETGNTGALMADEHIIVATAPRDAPFGR